MRDHSPSFVRRRRDHRVSRIRRIALCVLLLGGWLKSKPLGSQPLPDVRIEPPRLHFNTGVATPTVQLSIVVTAPLQGRLSYRIDAPEGIEVLPSPQGEIQVGSPLRLTLRLRDASRAAGSVHVTISGQGVATFGRDLPVMLVHIQELPTTPIAVPTPPPATPPPPPPPTPTRPVLIDTVPVTPTPAPRARDVKAYWNQWATNWQDEIVDRFDPPASESESAATAQKRLYRFYADLSGIDFSPVRRVMSRSAGETLEEVLSIPNLKDLTLQILPTVEGEGITLASPGGWQRVRVDVDQLRAEDVPKWQTEIREHPTPVKLFEIARAASALRDDQGKEWRPVRVDLRATKPGCAAVSLLIWNEDLSQPLDQVAWPVSVGGQPCRLKAASDRTLNGALLERFGVPLSQTPSAALHVFELKLNDKPKPVAVFALKGQPKPRHWPLRDSLTDILSTKLQPAADKARLKNGYYGYGEVSKVFEEVLFRGTEGAKALSDIRRLAKSGGRPLIYARIVANDGLSVALPLSLLDVEGKGPLGRYARVLSPLSHERVPGSTGCVARWSVLANGEIGELPDRMKPPYTDWAKARDYLSGGGCANVAARPSEAVFLLAHHPVDGSEAIGYDADDTLTVSGLTRCYPPGSIGLFFLCQFANPKPSRVALTCLEAFNENGLDAAVASTFSLDDTFARHFLAALQKTVRDLPRSTTLGDLFDATVSRLKTDYGEKDADEAFELALIGNQDLKVCGSGNE